MTEVSAKVGPDGKPFSTDYNFGSDLAAMSELFGEDVVYEKAKANMIVALQGLIRTHLVDGKSAKDINAAVSEWNPGLRKRGKSKAEKLRDDFQDLDPAVRAELLKEFASG